METHFGYQTINESEKNAKVGAVFDSVAPRYDVMNDLMSVGMHRLWKRFAVKTANPQAREKFLDIASGTGDIAVKIAKRVVEQGGQANQITITDINASMLDIGRSRLINEGFLVEAVVADCEALPFKNNQFHCATLAFGLRNMTHKEVAIKEILRVLKPGGRLLILEFSKIWTPLTAPYDFFSFNVIPPIGQMVTGDRDSYQYLVESIRMHPSQDALKTMMEEAGFSKVEYWNLAAGAVALHRGYKI